jgi:UDP-N-acetylmuramoylalanine--D-glutamate ligase
VLAACAIAQVIGVPADAMRQAVEGFTGVAHRLELVRSVNGIAWYNDSIATAPERAIADIHSFDEPLVLLAGGRDKNLPWHDFARFTLQRVKHLVLFGEAAGKISQAMEEALAEDAGKHNTCTITRVGGLRQAVQAAAELAQPGDVVLLSPGGTSFDEFRDFEERGEVFRKWVKDLS